MLEISHGVGVQANAASAVAVPSAQLITPFPEGE